MRRIGRWMLNGLTVLSLLLCVGTCTLWVRSYHVSEDVGISYPTFGASASSAKGGVRIGFYTLKYPDEESLQLAYRFAEKPFRYTRIPEFLSRYPLDKDDRTLLHALGIDLDIGTALAGGNVDSHFRFLTLPYWALVAMLGVAPIWALARVLRGRWRRRAGLCAVCRYDLTGNISGVCPECGSSVAKGN